MMLPSWAARQGDVGDLRSKSKEELLEILSRQEKLLSNKRFVHSLPDKGKKIADFVQKVHLALGLLADEEEKQACLISVRTEFQSKYKLALTKRGADNHLDSNLDSSLPSSDRNNVNDCSDVADTQEIHGVFGQKQYLASHQQPAAIPESAVVNPSASVKSDMELVEAFQQVTIDESNSSNKSTVPSIKKPQRKPHYLEVLEKTEKSAPTRKPRFKLNQRVVKCESTSPSQPSGSATSLTANVRRQDRKHLDDITAAKLPPLHHSPALLLSLEESALLLHEQTKKQLELQAKQAAQKLAESLNVRMDNYHPEGGPLPAYKEEYDDGALLSSEEDQS